MFNDETLRIKDKVLTELKEAEKKMARFDFGGIMGYQPINYEYWKKEVLFLRRELRDIDTGRVKY